MLLSGIDRLTAFEYEGFEQRMAQTLDRRAFILAFALAGIDGFADIGHAYELVKFY